MLCAKLNYAMGLPCAYLHDASVSLLCSMASVMAPFSFAPATKKVSHWTNLPTPPLVAVRKHPNQTFWRCSSSAATSTAPVDILVLFSIVTFVLLFP